MSIQTRQTNSCCPNKKTYTVTDSEKDNTIQKICNTCFSIELKSKNYPDTLIKIFQREIIKIICISCNENVTATMGCKTCHPELFSNLQNMKENQP